MSSPGPEQDELPDDFRSAAFWRREAAIFAAGLGYFTRIPIPRSTPWQPSYLGLSLVYLPLIGIIVGGLAALAYWIAGSVWGPGLAVVAALAVGVMVTGAFHEDGLADAADGLGGGMDRVQKLEIMKDSRIGTYGVLAVLLVIGAKAAALLSMPPPVAVCALIAGHVAGRWSSLPLIFWGEYARDEGKAKPVAGTLTPIRFRIASGLALIALAIFAGASVIAVVVVILVVTALAYLFFRRQVGGITGDLLGAANQMCELSCYLVIAAMIG